MSDAKIIAEKMNVKKSNLFISSSLLLVSQRLMNHKTLYSNTYARREQA